MRWKLLVVAVLVAALFVADQTVLAPPRAQAAAINVSAAAEHRIRMAVNRYAEIQVSQREPYCYGGTGPDCFDCSGLVVAAYRWAGVKLPVRTSTQLRRWATGTSLRFARTGDLLFYREGKPLSGRSKQLCDTVKKLGLDVATYVPTWPLAGYETKNIVTAEEMRRGCWESP